MSELRDLLAGVIHINTPDDVWIDDAEKVADAILEQFAVTPYRVYTARQSKADIAAARAVMDWFDADPGRRLVGCTPSMVAGVALNAARQEVGS